MTTFVLPQRLEVSSVAGVALKTAARFWFLAVVIGQWAFLYYIAAVYGTTTVRGDFPAWSRNTFLIKGYVAGDTAGNLAFAAHALLAGVIAFGGVLQLVPRIRARAMAVHRWNGRLFTVTAIGASITGLYMVWVRGTKVSEVSAIAVSINALLILLFAVLSWRTAIAHDATAHRGWALRLFMVANGQWFFRVGYIAWIIVNRGPVGMTDRFDGPFDYFCMFGGYLVPLAMLELYLRAKESGSARAQFAVAGALFVLTVLMSVGIGGVYFIFWRPILARF